MDYFFLKNKSQKRLKCSEPFTDKSRTGNHIILNEKGLTPLKIHRKMQPSSINIFSSIIKNFNLKNKPITLADFGEIRKTIKEKFKNDHFSFKPFTENEVTDVIFKLPTNTASASSDILKSISKQSVHVYCAKLTNITNDCLKNKTFLDYLKNAQINRCHKKDKGNK